MTGNDLSFKTTLFECDGFIVEPDACDESELELTEIDDLM
jgi:hypothetical protein